MKTLTLEEFHFELRGDRVYDSINYMTLSEVIKLSEWLNNIVRNLKNEKTRNKNKKKRKCIHYNG